MNRLGIIVLVCGLATLIAAHGHHDDVDPDYENSFIEDGPIDTWLKLHIVLQTISWAILFPAGMILGMTKNRWHVPVQSFTIVIVLIANRFAHWHGGRKFHTTAHAKFSKWVFWFMILQGIFGIFLKTHKLEGSWIRRFIKGLHNVMGKMFPIVGFVQMFFGVIAAQGFCFGDGLGQCLAHYIMGSSFVAYGCIMLIMARFGGPFLEKLDISQELLDSTVIMIWGIVNTYTEHDFFGPSGYWSHKDMQHVSLGVQWWAGGAAGIVTSWRKRRSIFPAIIIMMTGYVMSGHEQAMAISTKVHSFFGLALIIAGVCRIIEICFVLNDGPADNNHIRVWQQITPFCMVLGGVCFASATDEQLKWISKTVEMDHMTYLNAVISVAFAIYSLIYLMLHFYSYMSQRQKGDSLDVNAHQYDPEYLSTNLQNPTSMSSTSPMASSGLTTWSIPSVIKSILKGVPSHSPTLPLAQYESVPLSETHMSRTRTGSNELQAEQRTVFSLQGEDEEE